MAENNFDDEMKQALEHFFGGKISVYEAGSDEDRPKEFLDRPFLSILPDSSTYFIESLKSDTKGDGSYAVTANNALQDGSLDTNASKTFKAIEERFNKVKPNQKLFVIDSDAIRTRYALDESSNRSLAKSIVEYIKEKKEKYGVQNNFPAENEKTDKLIDSAFNATSAFSRTQFGNVSEENLKGDFSVSLIVVQNPDDLQKKWMVSIPGVPERMAKDGITHDNLCRFTIYHEFGHALDDLSNRGMVPYLIDANPEAIMARYHKECFADAHAVLQMARDDKNTKSGELLADIRITNVARRVLDLQGKKGREEVKPEIEKKLEQMQKNQPQPKNENAEGKKIRSLEQLNEEYGLIKTIGDHMAYYTTPVVDAAVDFAQKGLKDGSLLKMSDAEVLDVCRKLVDENTLSNNRMNEIRTAIFEGNESNPDILAIRKRIDVADNNMPITKEEISQEFEDKKAKIKAAQEKKLKSYLGIPSSEKEKKPVDAEMILQNISKQKALIAWNDTLFEKIEQEGYTKEGILKIVKDEKDEIRKHHGRTPDVLRDAKIKVLNDALLSQPDVYIAKSRVRATVRNTIAASKTIGKPKQTSETNIINHYLKLKIAVASYAETSVANAMQTDLTTVTPEAFLTAKNQEIVNYNKVMIAEKSSQELAFAVCKDKKRFDDLKKANPNLAEMIQNSAKRRHPSCLEEYHLSFGSSDKKQLEETFKKLDAYRNVVTKIETIFTKKTQDAENSNTKTVVAQKLNNSRN